MTKCEAYRLALAMSATAFVAGLLSAGALHFLLTGGGR